MHTSSWHSGCPADVGYLAFGFYVGEHEREYRSKERLCGVTNNWDNVPKEDCPA